ncbi:unnamed protein product [Adineta steineri]|uniref:Cyclin-like domain-containing protein n=1 Tax=Adineta steineri TaxID=433720 RepID=A0A813MEK8_9BILA|nr:unnamed protein product [Adineta steineri]CAF3748850.1 unnamed protein product [Adineta steineri]
MLHKTSATSTTIVRNFKRSISPDYTLSIERKSKTTKFEFTKNVGNKENVIKRVQSEMIFTKHSSFVFKQKENQINIPWYQSHRLWSNMMNKTHDKTYKCRVNFLDSHPSITTKMRSVLFDWLIEVSEVYHLHRETYHLSIAYIDQYLCKKTNLSKNKFQLLGITSLFVAAKLEEIYPPRLSDFSYVTDNTCSEDDILDMELDLMNILNWHINPITSISWLLIYLQSEIELKNILNNNDLLIKKQHLLNNEILQSSLLTNVHRSKDFLQIFSLAVRLLDLCSLDIEYNQFSKHVLAASAILLCKTNWAIEEITGLTNNDICICKEWMKPFSEVLNNSLSNSTIRLSSDVPIDEVYSIQIHNISIDLLENVYKKRPKFIPTMIHNRPFRDLLNHLSWLPTLLEKQQDEKQINKVVAII